MRFKHTYLIFVYLIFLLTPYAQAEAKVNIINIRHNFDLKGKKWEIPDGSTLIIARGVQICNGSIIFNNTTIDADIRCFAPDLVLLGSISGKVNIEWFDIHYNELFDNSTAINSALAIASGTESHLLKLRENTVIYVRSHYDDFNLAANDKIKYLRSGTVSIPSNTIFDLNGSEIRCLPNDKAQYNILFSRESHNISIKNGSIIGDGNNHKYGKGTDEWGYGIELQGVKDYTIENVYCKDCTGDGIDIQASLTINNGRIEKVVNCKNGLISGCFFERNGRNNMSIQGCDSLHVVNCLFQNANRTAPRAGIDIEPSISYGIAKNIRIEGCQFRDNKTYGVTIHKIAEGVIIDEILIKNCIFSSAKSNYHIFNNGGSNVSMLNCSLLTEVHEPYQIRVAGADNTKIEACTSEVNNGISVLIDGKVRDCFISECDLSLLKFHQYQNETALRNICITHCNFIREGIHYCLMEHLSTLKNITAYFDDCTFDYKNSVFTNLSQRAFILPEGEGVTYAMTNCKFLGNGTKISLSPSMKITESILDKTKLSVSVSNGSNVIFTNNTLSNHVDSDNAAIEIIGSRGTSFSGDFTGLRIVSSVRPLKSVIKAKHLNTTKVKMDKKSNYGSLKIIQQ